MSKKSKYEGNPINQGDPDDIMRQSNKSKNQHDNMEKIKSVGKGPKQDLGKETNQSSSPMESPISVVGESPCRQVDSLLVSRLLRPRQKVLNMDIDFIFDLIKLMNEREGERYVPYERRFSLQSSS
jgi:hypothetical protein